MLVPTRIREKNVSSSQGTPNSENTSEKRVDRRSLPRSLENSTQPALRPERSATASPPQKSPQNPSGDALDVKSQIARHGVGATLQRIFKNAISEQKTQSSSDVAAAPLKQTESHREIGRTQTKVSTSNSIPQTNSKPLAGAQSSIAQKQLNVPRSDVPTVSENIRDLAVDIWKSISTVTQVPQVEAASNPSSGAAARASESISLTWRDNGWLLLVLAVFALLFLTLTGRRMQLAATHKALERGWTTEILRAGVRTRTDVIRAFHHFALQRPQPVATWWHHRYVARRLSESSPQLSTAIQELTGLYEFARYQRPELELSTEQLLRVQAVLRQCNA